MAHNVVHCLLLPSQRRLQYSLGVTNYPLAIIIWTYLNILYYLLRRTEKRQAHALQALVVGILLCHRHLVGQSLPRPTWRLATFQNHPHYKLPWHKAITMTLLLRSSLDGELHLEYHA